MAEVKRQETKAQKATFLAIGKFIAYFSELELCLRWTAIAAIGKGNDEPIEIILQMLDYTMLCKIAQHTLLLQEHDQRPTEKVIKAVINRCIEMGSKRNIIAHGSWENGGAKHTSRQTLQPVYSFDDINELDELSEKLLQLQTEVLNLCVFHMPNP